MKTADFYGAYKMIYAWSCPYCRQYHENIYEKPKEKEVCESCGKEFKTREI